MRATRLLRISAANIGPNRVPPEPDHLVADVDPAFGQQIKDEWERHLPPALTVSLCERQRQTVPKSPRRIFKCCSEGAGDRSHPQPHGGTAAGPEWPVRQAVGESPLSCALRPSRVAASNDRSPPFAMFCRRLDHGRSGRSLLLYGLASQPHRRPKRLRRAYLARPFIKASNPSSRVAGVGGQPGMKIFTGTTLVTPPATA